MIAHNTVIVGIISLSLLIGGNLGADSDKTVFTKDIRPKGITTNSVTYYNDFENIGTLTLGPRNVSTYELKFVGLNKEKSYSGKSSLKLDFSVPENATGTYCYWYLKLPSPIPLRNPTYLSAYVWGVEGGGCLGVEFNAKAEKKNSQPCFRKESSFDPGHKNWRKVRINIYPTIKNICERYDWEVDNQNVTVDAISVNVIKKPPYETIVYLDDVCVDYLEHNPEAMGLPMKDLYLIVKRKMTTLKARLDEALPIIENDKAKVDSDQLWKQLHLIGTQIMDLSCMPADDLADMRIQLDSLYAEYKSIVENMEAESLFK